MGRHGKLVIGTLGLAGGHKPPPPDLGG